jgi:hypothetical protein
LRLRRRQKRLHRHTKVAVEDPAAAALTQAEDAIAKKGLRGGRSFLTRLTQPEPLKLSGMGLIWALF